MIDRLAAHATLLLAAGEPTRRDPLQSVNPGTDGLPGQATSALNKILSWSMYGAVTACGIAALISAGFAGWARMTARPQHFDRGLTAFGWAVGCGFLVGIAIPLVNTFYNLAI
ncbi:hypothetical protein [Frankia sp. AgB32]|uniref:hypothetical protein n=1 Tax=Frankia sp. AgB32 TaxID=631119 RepID=UPI00200DBF96|nr:hypothetical protein [Frankia sp. AgB32]MCK9897412.1 hypothetical protein [Frankia sp. AgB32]